MAVVITLTVVASLVLSSNSYSYNQLLDRYSALSSIPRYPDTCCQLEWTNIGPKDPLPKEYVLAGKLMIRDWAYVGLKSWYKKGRVAVKSDEAGAKPNWLGEGILPEEFAVHRVSCPPDHECIVGSRSNCSKCRRVGGERIDLIIEPTPILTNPNKCYLGWYRTKFMSEVLPENGDWNFPRMSNTRYGDFAQLNGRPARRDGDGEGAAIATSLTNFDYDKPQRLDMLYVDCKRSIPRMSMARLYDIAYHQDDFNKLKSESHRLIYSKKVLFNYSPTLSEVYVEFQVQTFDNATLKLLQSFAPYFNVGYQSSSDLSTRAHLRGLFKAIEMGRSSKVNEDRPIAIVTGRADSGEIFKASARRELFVYAQKVKIPPFSKVTLTAFSEPIKGKVPFKAVYELVPTANTHVRVLEGSLKKYGMNSKMEKTGKGTLLVHYDGLIHVDSGHQVFVDIETERITSVFSNLFFKSRF